MNAGVFALKRIAKSHYNRRTCLRGLFECPQTSLMFSDWLRLIGQCTIGFNASSAWQTRLKSESSSLFNALLIRVGDCCTCLFCDRPCAIAIKAATTATRGFRRKCHLLRVSEHVEFNSSETENIGRKISVQAASNPVRPLQGVKSLLWLTLGLEKRRGGKGKHWTFGHFVCRRKTKFIIQSLKFLCLFLTLSMCFLIRRQYHWETTTQQPMIYTWK